jgi:CxxC motif-containing protein (DUF1111 family)
MVKLRGMSSLLAMGAVLGGSAEAQERATRAAGVAPPLVDRVSVGPLGSSLPGISRAAFAAARANFDAVEDLTDGLGPIFNERACGNCHSNGANGGAGEQIERRFGRFVNGIFDPFDATPPEIDVGGSLLQLFTVGNFNNPNLPPGSRGSCRPGNPTLCCVPQEVIPPQATVRAGRLTTPLFGLGLVDAMPDSFFHGLAAAQPAAIRGTARVEGIIFPNVQDPSQSIGTPRVARFGWKAAVTTLQQFAADAYLNEMGITTQSCFRGTSINMFATENLPDANPVSVPVGCDDLAPFQPPAVVAATGIPINTDDAVGSCAGGKTEVQADIANFFAFMTFLAPPGPDAADRADTISIKRGSPLFTSTGCSGCHVRTTFVTPPAPPTGVPGNFAFHPYSDFLVHDMGSLGDMIGADPGETIAQTRRMRTAPLWGIKVRNHLLHDGRTSDIAMAIRAHDGQGAAARNAFLALSAPDQHALVQFVRSIGYDTP